MRGRMLGELVRELMEQSERGELECGAFSEAEKQVLSVISETGELRELVLTEYVNDNGQSGLAAYVLRSADGVLHCVFRGSERQGCGVSDNVDWRDNFLAPLCGSVQYEGVERLVRRFRGRQIVFSGHSKGAHNALYALAVCEGGGSACVFNGQGFARGQTDKTARERLRDRGVNYVVCGDPVGVLLHHPERRVFVKKQGTGNAHALASFSFDAQGVPTEGIRPLWTWLLEWVTQLGLPAAKKCGNVVKRIAFGEYS